MKKKFKRKKIPLFYATFQCGRYSVFKKISTFFFTPEKLKNRPQKLLIISPTPFFSQSSPAQTTAHSPELSFHIMKFRDQTSVLLSVEYSKQFLMNLVLFCLGRLVAKLITNNIFIWKTVFLWKHCLLVTLLPNFLVPFRWTPI